MKKFVLVLLPLVFVAQAAEGSKNKRPLQTRSEQDLNQGVLSGRFFAAAFAGKRQHLQRLAKVALRQHTETEFRKGYLVGSALAAARDGIEEAKGEKEADLRIFEGRMQNLENELDATDNLLRSATTSQFLINMRRDSLQHAWDNFERTYNDLAQHRSTQLLSVVAGRSRNVMPTAAMSYLDPVLEGRIDTALARYQQLRTRFNQVTTLLG